MNTEITIAGAKFSIAPKYAEGHQLNALEAKALNRMFCENVGNNTRKAVAEFVTAGETEKAANLVAETAKTYEFSLRASGIGAARVTDPIEKIALSMAKELLIAAYTAKGLKFVDVAKADPAAMKERIAKIAAMDKTRAEAEKTHKARQKALLTVAGDEDLTGI